MSNTIDQEYDKMFSVRSCIPEDVRAAYNCVKLGPAEKETLRKFLVRRVIDGLSHRSYLNALTHRFGVNVAQEIWNTETSRSAFEEYSKRLKAQSEIAGDNTVFGEQIKLSAQELRERMYNMKVVDVPGWRLVNNVRKLNQRGRSWIRQMCYVMAKDDVDHEPFLTKMIEHFDFDQVNELADVIDKAVTKAKSLNALPLSDEHKDSEGMFLSGLASHMRCDDIPDLEPNESGALRKLSRSSVFWIQDKIRRIMVKNLVYLQPFLMKVTDMFGKELSKIFTRPFRKELIGTLMPRFDHKLDLLEKWLCEPPYEEDTSAPLLPLEPPSVNFLSTGVALEPDLLPTHPFALPQIPHHAEVVNVGNFRRVRRQKSILASLEHREGDASVISNQTYGTPNSRLQHPNVFWESQPASVAFDQLLPEISEEFKADLMLTLYDIDLMAVPGWDPSPQSNGKPRLNATGLAWVRRMCFLLAKNQLDLEPFLSRLYAILNDAELDEFCKDLWKIVARVTQLKGDEHDQANQINIKAATSVTSSYSTRDSIVADNTQQSLSDASTTEPTSVLSQESVLFIQDQIRKIMQQNSPILQEFLKNTFEVFRQHVKKLLTPEFCDELLQLETRYSHDVSLLQQWLESFAAPAVDLASVEQVEKPLEAATGQRPILLKTPPLVAADRAAATVAASFGRDSLLAAVSVGLKSAAATLPDAGSVAAASAKRQLPPETGVVGSTVLPVLTKRPAPVQPPATRLLPSLMSNRLSAHEVRNMSVPAVAPAYRANDFRMSGYTMDRTAGFQREASLFYPRGPPLGALVRPFNEVTAMNFYNEEQRRFAPYAKPIGREYGYRRI